MLVSHRHRFIFVKTRKTAGTSVELSLARYCDGPDDVVTRISPGDTELQQRLGVEPRNYLDAATGKKRFWNHCSATRIRRQLGSEIWNGYTTFCFLRNPWDRVVSQYWFRHRRTRRRAEEPKISFEDFVSREEFTTEIQRFSRRSEVLVDHVGRFENLSDDLRHITSKIGLEWDGWLPHAKGGVRPREPHYSEYYTPELAAIVARRCRLEIEFMGYRFEAPPHRVLDSARIPEANA